MEDQKETFEYTYSAQQQQEIDRSAANTCRDRKAKWISSAGWIIAPPKREPLFLFFGE